MKENVIVEKSFAFAIRIVKLYRYLLSEKKEYILSRQICKSGSSIGANVAEAQRAQSTPDFAAKMNIALKEAGETDYWLRLLHETGYVSEQAFVSLYQDLQELEKLLGSICKKLPQKK